MLGCVERLGTANAEIVLLKDELETTNAKNDVLKLLLDASAAESAASRKDSDRLLATLDVQEGRASNQEELASALRLQLAASVQGASTLRGQKLELSVKLDAEQEETARLRLQLGTERAQAHEDSEQLRKLKVDLHTKEQKINRQMELLEFQTIINLKLKKKLQVSVCVCVPRGATGLEPA